MIGMKLLCAKRLSPTAKLILPPMITARTKAMASSYRVSHKAAGTPGSPNTSPSENSTVDGGLRKSRSTKNRAATSQTIMSTTTTPSRTTPGWLLRHPGVVRLGVVVVLMIVWEVAARFFVDRDFLSPPSTVLFSLGDVFGEPGVPAALWLTLYELAIAFVLAVIIGGSISLAVGLSRFAHKSFMPIILLIYGLPQITILPIFILLFGINAASKIAFGVSHGMFPIMIAVAAGVQNMKPILHVSARSMGANHAQI